MITLAVAGLAINLLLLSRHWPGGSAAIAGCGGGDCDEVLSSRWAYVFRLPVSVFGGGAYLLLLASFFRRWRALQIPALGLIVGGACWFLFVMAVLLEGFCPWCVAAHSLAVSLCAICLIRMMRRRAPQSSYCRLGGWVLAGILCSGLSQIYGPLPATHQLDAPVPLSAVDSSARSGNPVPQSDPALGRDVSGLPLLGNPDARHVLVEYFDYHCKSCLRMSEYLTSLTAKYPDLIAVRLAAVPIDRLCNSHVESANDKPGSCEMAKISLAVWKHAPLRFPDFHREIFSNPNPVAVRQAAEAIISAKMLEARLNDPRVADLIRTNVADWQRYSQGNVKLPKLRIGERRMLHGLPPDEETFLRVMRQELGL